MSYRILVGAVLVFPVMLASAWARTVVLVYDDSGSMVSNDQHENRMVYADYSLQNLIALLSPDDRLVVVRTSDVEHSRPPLELLPQLSKDEAIAQVARWKAGGGTPYETVSRAIAKLEALAAKSSTTDEGYWLVVLSDGEFQLPNTPQNAPQNVGQLSEAIRHDVRTLYSNFTNQRLGVVYLGIGSQADGLAAPWEQAGARTFTAGTAPQISEAMFTIASLITGRDVGNMAGAGLKVTYKGNAAHLKSALPLHRLVMFYQGKRNPDLSAGAEASLKPVSGGEIRLENHGPYKTAGGGLHGLVNILSTSDPDRVLPPGNYTVPLITNIAVSPKELRFLPEVTLALSVSRAPEANALCIGNTVMLSASLTNPQSGTPVDLSNLADLTMKATVTGVGTGTRKVALQPHGATSFSATLNVVSGQETVSVAARYPGYFNLRSRLFTLTGKSCITHSSLNITPPTLNVKRTAATALSPVGMVHLTLRGSGTTTPLTNVPYQLSAEDLPTGVALAIAGKRLTRARPKAKVNLTFGKLLSVTVLRDRDFTHSGKNVITLHAETADSRLSAAARQVSATLSLNLASRKLALVPQTPNWRYPLDKLNTAPPDLLTPQVNGGPVSPQEFSQWRVEVARKPFRIGAKVTKQGGAVAVSLHPYPPKFFWFLNRTSAIRPVLRVTTPYNETFSASPQLFVVGLPWWRRFGALIITLVAIIVAGILIARAIARPKFVRGAKLLYNYYDTKADLNAGRAHFNDPQKWKLKNEAPLRWLTGQPDICIVKDLTFEAAKGGTIKVPKTPVDGSMRLGYDPPLSGRMTSIVRSSTAKPTASSKPSYMPHPRILGRKERTHA